MPDKPTFGIDLGTSTSAISWLVDGRPTLIPVEEDQYLLPSAVTFRGDNDVLIGREALNSLQAMPESTIVSSKRKMGSEHRYSLPTGNSVTPVDVAALLLERLADAAEEHTGTRPEKVVVTVPAWFSEAQRADTRAAGTKAGLEVARIINEPTAAALAHARNLEEPSETLRRVLVYDLGGGTFDVSLVERTGPVVEVQASHGDSELGGDDVDVLLRDRVLRRIDQKRRDLVDAIVESPAAMLRLKNGLEQVKIQLGEQPTAWLTLPFVATVDGKPEHLELELQRADLDWAADFVIQRSLSSVDQVLKDADITAEDIDELLLVGGSTYLPQLWHALQKRYGLEGSHAVHPRKAVALGAAIQAAILDGVETCSVLMDVAPFSLSVGVADPRPSTGKMHFLSRVITPRNTPLPSHHTEIFYASDRQKKFQIPVFQGSHTDPRNNVFLGQIEFDDLPSSPDTEDRPIHVEFRHNLDGMVEISVTDALSRRTQSASLAADGTQQVQMRQEWLERMKRNDVIFGDGAGLVDDHKAPVGSEFRSSHNAVFNDVLQHAEEIKADFPGSADELLSLAHRGLDAEPADAEKLGEKLADLMFELGLYLDD